MTKGATWDFSLKVHVHVLNVLLFKLIHSNNINSEVKVYVLLLLLQGLIWGWGWGEGGGRGKVEILGYPLRQSYPLKSIHIT